MPWLFERKPEYRSYKFIVTGFTFHMFFGMMIPKPIRRICRKHGVGFREAATIFEDRCRRRFRTKSIRIQSGFITIGLSALGRMLVVAHTEVRGTIRIISAREVTSRERRFYEEN